MENSARNLKELYDVMEDDFVMACDLVTKEKNSPSRHLTAKRFAIRAGAALVEGFVYQLRLYCIAAHENSEIKLDAPELLALQEKQVKIEKGAVKLSNKHQPIEEGIDFVFSIYAKLCGCTFKVHKGGKDWSNFKAFFPLETA